MQNIVLVGRLIFELSMYPSEMRQQLFPHFAFFSALSEFFNTMAQLYRWNLT
ncbi:hypothetical protein HGE74_09485 [Rhodobacteraceae bacterium R_SAG1]|nr:hypothetical protein [Rhodobacteraceae bacterium R_SAG1]